MASKRIGLVTGGLLAGALLLGTAGLVAAEDPTPTPAAAGPGSMMSGQTGAGMMSGQTGAGMMSGQMGAGMMSGQLEQMNALHDQMIASGVCDPAQMQALHAQLNADR